jgi:hypothetical protein
MFGLIHKVKTKSLRTAVILTGFLVVLSALPSVTAYAANNSATFAILCKVDTGRVTAGSPPTPTSDSKGNVSCGQDAAGFVVYITATGQKAANDTTDTVVVVNCGNSSPKSYQVNQVITKFECQNGTPSVQTTRVAGQGSTGTQLCSDTQNQALCPYCSQNPPPSGCVNAQSDSSVTCNGSQCDLVSKYVNPAIGLLSVVFGLLAVISLILGGINFATSEGDPQKASKAKQRIFNTVVAVVAYVFLYSFLQFLVPGGIFNRP